MSPEYWAEKCPGLWNPALELFRVLHLPDGSGHLDISFINPHSIRLGITPIEVPGTLRDVWLYEDFATALAAAYTWASRGFEGEPYGWHRHPSTGRRRHNGSHEREFYQP